MSTGDAPSKSEYDRLLRFLVRPGGGFGLAVAHAATQRDCDRVAASVRLDLRGGPRQIGVLDLETIEDGDLVDMLARQAEAGAHVILVQHGDRMLLDAWMRPRIGVAIERLNRARDELPGRVSARVVRRRAAGGRSRALVVRRPPRARPRLRDPRGVGHGGRTRRLPTRRRRAVCCGRRMGRRGNARAPARGAGWRPASGDEPRRALPRGWGGRASRPCASDRDARPQPAAEVAERSLPGPRGIGPQPAAKPTLSPTALQRWGRCARTSSSSSEKMRTPKYSLTRGVQPMPRPSVLLAVMTPRTDSHRTM